MTWTLRFDCEAIGWPPGPNDRLHWSARAKRVAEWRQRVWLATGVAEIPHLDRARVSVTFHTARGRAMDVDNLVGRCKALYDGLTGCTIKGGWFAGVLKDDNAAHLEHGPVAEIRDGQRAIEMLVEAVYD